MYGNNSQICAFASISQGVPDILCCFKFNHTKTRHNVSILDCAQHEMIDVWFYCADVTILCLQFDSPHLLDKTLLADYWHFQHGESAVQFKISH